MEPDWIITSIEKFYRDKLKHLFKYNLVSLEKKQR